MNLWLTLFGVAADLIAALVAFATVSLSSEEPLKEDRLWGAFLGYA